jgi:hypothetical protein
MKCINFSKLSIKLRISSVGSLEIQLRISKVHVNFLSMFV